MAKSPGVEGLLIWVRMGGGCVKGEDFLNPSCTNESHEECTSWFGRSGMESHPLSL